MLPAGLAQSGDDPPFEIKDQPFAVRVTRLDVPAPLHLDGANPILGTVRNEGLLPLAVQVTILARDPLGASYELLHNNATLLPGESQDFQLEWDVRDASGDAMTAPVNITLRAQPPADLTLFGHELSVERNVVIHDLGLTLVQDAAGASMDAGSLWNSALVVQVINDGSTHETVELAVEDAPPGWTFTLSQAELPLPSGAAALVSIFIQSAPDAPAFRAAMANVTVRSSQPLAPATPGLPIASPTVRPTGALFLSVDRMSAEAAPGTQVTFNVTAFNGQNFLDEVAIVLEAQDSGAPPATVNPADSVSISEASQHTYTVTMAVPTAAAAGQHAWTVQAISQHGDDITMEQPLVVDVEHVRAVTFSLAAGAPQSIEPGSALVLPLQVENRGNGPDVFTIRLEETPPRWNASTEQATPTVPAGQTLQFAWEARPASNASAGPIQLRLTAEPIGLPQARTPTLTHVLAVIEKANGSLDAEFPTLPADPGETVAFQLTLANVGNVASTFLFDVEVDTAQPNDGSWTLHGTYPRTLDLDADQAMPATVNVTAPASMALSDRFILQARLTETETGQVQEITLRALKAVPDLLPVLRPTEPDPGYKDQPWAIHFDVRNDGAALAGPTQALVRLFETGPDGEAGSLILSRTLSVGGIGWEPGNNTHALNTTIVPDTTSIWVGITVDAAGAIQEADEENNVLAQRMDLHHYRVNVTAPTDFQALPGQHINLTGDAAFVIRNHGEHTERIRVLATAAPAWIETRQDTIDLVPGATHRVPIDFTVPLLPGVPEGLVVVNVTSVNVPTLTQERSVRIPILDDAPPEIQSFTINAPVTDYSGALRFEARLSDATGIESAKVVVSARGNAANIPLEHRADGTFFANFTATTLGDHTAYLWTRDRSTAANTNTTAATPLQFFVRPPDRPVITLVSPASGAIAQPGTPLVYHIVSGRPISAVAAVVDALPSPLPAATIVQLDTTAWPDGPRAVNVTAVDSIGATGSLQHAVIIDGTPPEVTQIELSPRQPQPGQSVHIRATVQDVSPIRQMMLRLETDDGVVEDTPMTPDADAFVARVTLRAPLASLTVLATDEAGNVGSRHAVASELATESSPSMDLPAGFLLAPLAIAAVGFALRRAGGRAR